MSALSARAKISCAFRENIFFAKLGLTFVHSGYTEVHHEVVAALAPGGVDVERVRIRSQYEDGARRADAGLERA
jgi:hypothetical protein